MGGVVGGGYIEHSLQAHHGVEVVQLNFRPVVDTLSVRIAADFVCACAGKARPLSLALNIILDATAPLRHTFSFAYAAALCPTVADELGILCLAPVQKGHAVAS